MPERRAKIQCPNCGHEGEGVCTYHYPRKRSEIKSRRISSNAEDAAWSLLIRSRDGWKCRICGSTPGPGGLDAAHIFTRARKTTRHDPQNGVALCTGHHSWSHSYPDKFKEWVISWMGEEEYEALRVKSQTTPKRVKRKDTV